MSISNANVSLVRRTPPDDDRLGIWGSWFPPGEGPCKGTVNGKKSKRGEDNQSHKDKKFEPIVFIEYLKESGFLADRRKKESTDVLDVPLQSPDLPLSL